MAAPSLSWRGRISGTACCLVVWALALLHPELRYLPRCPTNIECQYFKRVPPVPGRLPLCIMTAYRSAANMWRGSSPERRSSRCFTTSCQGFQGFLFILYVLFPEQGILSNCQISDRFFLFLYFLNEIPIDAFFDPFGQLSL